METKEMSITAVHNKMVYLDSQSTVPVDHRVLAKMLPYFSETFSNPASAHALGVSVSEQVEQARADIARSIGAESHEIIFTSGATESNHLAFHSVGEMLIELNKTHLIVSAIEHKSILSLAKKFESKGFSLTVLPVNRHGFVEVGVFRDSIRSNTGLVSIMCANNEIGTIQPVGEIAEICAENDLIFHTDAAQALGRIQFDVSEVKCVFASLASHKIYGPKGIGALYVRGNAAKMGLEPIFIGGGQELGMRSGTLNVPGIIGFAEAARLANEQRETDSVKARRQVDVLWRRLSSAFPGIKRNGSVEPRLPNNLNICIPGVDSNALILSLHDVCISNGSACSSRTISASHVLSAIGLTDEECFSSVRLGVSRMTTDEEVSYAADRIIHEVGRILATNELRQTQSSQCSTSITIANVSSSQ